MAGAIRSPNPILAAGSTMWGLVLACLLAGGSWVAYFFQGTLSWTFHLLAHVYLGVMVFANAMRADFFEPTWWSSRAP